MEKRITIERISRNDNFREHMAAGRPVIIVDEVPSWKVYARWTLPYLRSVFSNRHEFALVEKRILSFSEFADKLETDQPNVFAPQLSLTGRPKDFMGPVDTSAYELVPDLEYPGVMDRAQLDEVNVWIGRGTTPLHFDAYDNFLAVVRGVKRVLLLEPEWFEHLYIDRHQWSSVDIEKRDISSFPRLSAVPEPLELRLEEGEMLYLPAYWLHQVDVPEGYALTLNYWYRCQHGVQASGFAGYFYPALTEMLRLYGDLNAVEKTLAARQLRSVVDQLAEGRSPGSQKTQTWSGGEHVFSKFRV